MSRHTSSAWQASPPGRTVTSSAVGSSSWHTYLIRQGYDLNEAQLHLEGGAGEIGLVELVPQRLEARAPDDRGAEAVQGIVVAYLEDRPPLAVLEVPPAPPRYLSPEQFGLRLEGVGEQHALGVVFRDRLTGNRWIVALPSREQGAAMVTAGALFNVLGIAAPSWRLVELEGRRAITVRELTNWHGIKVADHELVLSKRAAADAWLAFTPSRTNTRGRLHPIPGQPVLVRWDLRQAMGYSGAGRRDAGWGPKVPDTITSSGVPMLRKISRLADKTIRRAVAVGGLPEDQAVVQYGTLVMRREALRAQLARLTGS